VMSSENWNSKLSLQNRHHPLSHTWGRDRESAATADNPLCTVSVDLRPAPFIPGSGRLLPSSNDTRQTQGRPKSKCETPTPALAAARAYGVRGAAHFRWVPSIAPLTHTCDSALNSCAPLVHTDSSTLGAGRMPAWPSGWLCATWCLLAAFPTSDVTLGPPAS
jgi:hypothetical protein